MPLTDYPTIVRLVAETRTQATVGSVRLKLLKVAALVQVSVRRVYIKLSSAYPWQEIFRLCHQRLMAMCAADG